MIISKAPTVCQVLFQVVEMELCVGWMNTPSSLDEAGSKHVTYTQCVLWWWGCRCEEPAGKGFGKGVCGWGLQFLMAGRQGGPT